MAVQFRGIYYGGRETSNPSLEVLAKIVTAEGSSCIAEHDRFNPLSEGSRSAFVYIRADSLAGIHSELRNYELLIKVLYATGRSKNCF
jgi:hypothetical protein